MIVRCRAKISPSCYDGMECVDVYEEDSMRDDGLFDGETVICDPCYIAGGLPSLSAGSRRETVAYVNRVLGIRP